MELDSNQAALILSTAENGEITMDVESSDINGFASALCHALAKKIDARRAVAGGIDEDAGRQIREKGVNAWCDCM